MTARKAVTGYEASTLFTSVTLIPTLSVLSLLLQISKKGVIDDMVESNDVLYQPGEKPDHCVSHLSRAVSRGQCMTSAVW